MSPEISERSFEDAIECALLEFGPDACAGAANVVREVSPPYGRTPPGGYHKRRAEDYDRALCLVPRDVLDFVLATQPKEWLKLEEHHGAAVKEQFLRRLSTEIERRGSLDVLRGGIKDSGCKFRLAYHSRGGRGRREGPQDRQALPDLPALSAARRRPQTGDACALAGRGTALPRSALSRQRQELHHRLARAPARDASRIGSTPSWIRSRFVQRRCRRRNSSTSAASCRTTSGSTRSFRRCSPLPTPISKSSTASRATCGGG